MKNPKNVKLYFWCYINMSFTFDTKRTESHSVLFCVHFVMFNILMFTVSENVNN